MTHAKVKSSSPVKQKAVKLCKFGHLYVIGSHCEPCHSKSRSARHKKKCEEDSEYQAKFRAKRRECVKEWRAKNKEKDRANNRAFLKKRYSEDPAFRAKMRAAHEKRLLAIKADPVRSAEYREKSRLQYQRRRARLNGSGSSGMTPPQWREICARYADESGAILCAYCRQPCKPTIEHVVPIARGGRDEPSNIVPACKPCNSSKSDKLLSEWHGRVAA